MTGGIIIGEGFEQPLAKGIGIIYRQAGHGIEGAARVGAVNAGHAVEPGDEGISSFQVFGPGCVKVDRRQIGGGFAEDLGEGRGAQSCLGKFHNGVEHCLVAGHKRADAAAAGAVAFGDGVHHEYVVLCPLRFMALICYRYSRSRGRLHRKKGRGRGG